MTDCKIKIRTAIFALAALSYSSALKASTKPTKTRMDLRIVRSPQHDTPTNTAYVLSPQYQTSQEGDGSAEYGQQYQHSQVLTEAQYEVLLKQAQKALQGYDLTKLAPVQQHQPQEEQANAQVVYKPDVSIKYVYTDAPTSVTYNTAAVSYAAPSAVHSEHDYEPQDHYSKHKFGYRVHDPHSGAAYGHSEVSEGHVTKGQYHVLLPDGRLQSVKYVADDKGYHATVSYESYKNYY